MSLALEVHGLNETIGALERGRDTFPNDVGVRTVQQLTLMARRELQQGLSGVTVDRGFWGKGSPYGGQVGVRTGSLRQSISPGLVYRAGPVVTGVIGTADPRMKALETGETIRPTSGQFLRVPTKFAQTAAGVDRNAGRSMRDVPGTSVHPSKSGQLFIWANVDSTLIAFGAGGKVPGTTRGVVKGARARGEQEVPLYGLFREVKMPEKRTFRDTQVAMELKAPAIASGRAEIWLQQLAIAPGASTPL